MYTKEKAKQGFRDTTAPISFERAYDTRIFQQILQRIAMEYPSVKIAEIGESILGRSIPVITLGENRGSRGVLYLGGVCGNDYYSPAVLLRFIRDYAEFLENGKRIYSVSMPYLYENRTIHVIPMLNPDGYEIRKLGADEIPLGDRLKRMNGGDDFSNWQYNARGAALWENFFSKGGSDGVEAESEPEAAALCRYIRMTGGEIYGDIELVMEFHNRNSTIKCTSGTFFAPRSKTVARLISRMTGCEVFNPNEVTGEFSDFFMREMGMPAFSCGFCNENESSSAPQKPSVDEYLRIYAAFREALFSAPLLI